MYYIHCGSGGRAGKLLFTRLAGRNFKVSPGKMENPRLLFSPATGAEQASAFIQSQARINKEGCIKKSFPDKKPTLNQI